MTETLIVPRWLSIAICLGMYSALLPVLPHPSYVLLAIAPVLLVCVAWWTLTGAPDRWLMIFLCAAILLPPLPIAIGDSGPHLSLVIAALGLLAGLIRLPDWRIPTGALSRSILILFFVLLSSSALAAIYTGVPVALGTIARVMLFGISVYIFFFVT